MSARRGPARLAMAAMLAVLAGGGCAALKTAPLPRSFRLAYVPPTPVPPPPLSAVLRVVPFGIASSYDREVFLYRTGAYEIGVDYYDRWIANPATMITDLVARDLAAAQVVSAVLQSPSALPSNYELSAQVETFEERDEHKTCTAHLRMRALLVRATREGRAVAMQRNFVADETCERGDVDSYVGAMSRAVERASTDIRTAVVEAIRSGAEVTAPAE